MGATLPSRHRIRALMGLGLAVLTCAATLPGAAAAAAAPASERASGGGLSAVIRYTEYGIPHIVAEDYANLGFGTGWAKAADQVCTLADGFVTLRGGRRGTARNSASPGRRPGANRTQQPCRSLTDTALPARWPGAASAPA